MNNTLTYAALRELELKWEREMEEAAGATLQPSALRIIEVEPIPICGPVKRHRKRRIQKKWLKRYGVKIVGYDRYLGDQIFIYKKAGVGFCHPDVARVARREMMIAESKRLRELYGQA